MLKKQETKHINQRIQNESNFGFYVRLSLWNLQPTRLNTPFNEPNCGIILGAMLGCPSGVSSRPDKTHHSNNPILKLFWVLYQVAPLEFPADQIKHTIQSIQNGSILGSTMLVWAASVKSPSARSSVARRLAGPSGQGWTKYTFLGADTRTA